MQVIQIHQFDHCDQVALFQDMVDSSPHHRQSVSARMLLGYEGTTMAVTKKAINLSGKES